MPSPVPGTIHYAGAGITAPDHLTLRAANALRQADVVVSEQAPCSRLRGRARPDAEWIVAGPLPGRPALAAAEVLKLVEARAKGGRRVVRLIEGDPLFFSGVAPEVAQLRKAGLEVEVVPGVSALSAAAALGGVPLHAPSGEGGVLIVRGSDAEDAPAWVPHLRSGGLLVVLDPLPRLARLVEGLVEAGAPAALPCVAVARAGSPSLRRVAAGLDAFCGAVEQADIEGPAVVLIGAPVKERLLLPLNTALPLSGRRVVVTRTREQAGEWSPRLEALGAEVLELPLIQVTHKADPHLMAEVFAELGSYEWLVFTSANGVRGFMKAFFRAFSDIRSLGFVRIAAIGEGTVAALGEWHLKADLVPEKSDGAGLARALAETSTLDSARILVATGNLNRDELIRSLEEGRAIVDKLQVYETSPADLGREPAAATFRARGADAILFTSSSAVRSFVEQAKHLQLEPGARQPVAASIGSMTSATLREFSMPIAAEAETPSLESLVSALQRFWNKRK